MTKLVTEFTQSTAEGKPLRSRLTQLLAMGHLALIAATWNLWTPQTDFPQVPFLFIDIDDQPRIFDWGLLALLLASLITMLLIRHPRISRIASLICAFSTLGLVAIDQHRLQPWVWQFVIVAFVLGLADGQVATLAWRWLIISIYAWSAWSKIDIGFFHGHGRFLIDGFLQAVPIAKPTEFWPESFRMGMTAAIPLFELLIAIGLAWPRTRKVSVLGAAGMHLFLLLALGPWGHGHQPGVLIWNLFFLVQNGVLFRVSSQAPTETISVAQIPQLTRPNRLAFLIVSAAIIWPAFESAGYCDHWPAWAVYAARPERVSLSIHATELAKLPPSLNPYLVREPRPDDWQPFRLDRWSLATVQAPLYPQDRFQVGVALGLARRFDLNQIQLIIEGPANRWTGQRTIHRYSGLESINRLAGTFRCRAQPRQTSSF